MSTPSYNRHHNNPKAEQTLEAILMAKKLAVHTIKICSNENVFDPKYRGAITNDLIETAKDIYADAQEANNVYVGDDAEQWHCRKRLQDEALSKCKRMLALITLAREVFHLRGKKVNYWSELTVDTKDKIKAWRDSDRGRYGKLDGM